MRSLELTTLPYKYESFELISENFDKLYVTHVTSMSPQKPKQPVWQYVPNQIIKLVTNLL